MTQEFKKVDLTNPKDLIGSKKAPLSLVPSTGIIAEAMAFRDGDKKYGPYNFRSTKVQAMIYIDAALRHIYSWVDGEECAKDSGIHHLGHARACLNIILDTMENNNLIDNRPVSGKAASILSEAENFIKRREGQHEDDY